MTFASTLGASLANFFARSTPAGDIARALLRDTADGVALIDLAGRVQRDNAVFGTLTGMRTGDAAWSFLTGPARAALQTACGQGRPATLEAQLAGGRALRLSVLPIPRRGAVLRVVDRSHEQAVADQLGQSQRLQAVGELAGGIAHDFNNLLTAIIGAADDVRGRSQEGSEDCADLDQIRNSARRGAGLVRHLLAFSRQQTLQPRVVALNTAVSATADMLKRLLGAGVRLELALEEPGRSIHIDPTQLDQVLVNLVVNASRAMPSGGVVRVQTGHELLLGQVTRGGDSVPAGRYVMLSVTDTGVGIAPAILPRIFEPFFTTRRDDGGTGLGLSTVHGIVRQSGGFMQVASTRGAGTTFTILFPRHQDALLQKVAPPAPLAAKPGCGRVLLVDDEEPVRRLAHRVLERGGFEVEDACCGEEALEKMAARPAGCVVSDVVMPGMDGPALVRQLRAAHPGLRAVLISGYADAPLRAALTADDISFLAKPFAMRELAELVAAQFEEKKALSFL